METLCGCIKNVMRGCVGVDKEVVVRWLERFPELETFMGAGTISLKLAREILGVDRYFMNDIFKDLLQAGAVISCSGNAWRATKECQELLAERRIKRDKSVQN